MSLLYFLPLPVVATGYLWATSRRHYVAAASEWTTATTAALDAITHERNACADPSAFRVDREGLVDALDRADRAGVNKSHPTRLAACRELAQSLESEPDSGDNDGIRSEDDSSFNAETVVSRCPEVLSQLSRVYRLGLMATIRRRKGERRSALFRYLVTQSGAKVAVYATVICVSALRAKFRFANMLSCPDIIGDGCGFSWESAALLGAVLAHDARVLCVDATCEGLLTRLSQAITERHRNAQKAKFYRQLLLMDMSYFDLHTASDIDAVSFFIHDLEGVDVQLHLHLMKVVATTSKLLYLVRMDKRCAGVLLATGFVSTLLLRYVRSVTHSMQMTSRDEGGGLDDNGYLAGAEEVLDNIKAFRALSVDRSLLAALDKPPTGQGPFLRVAAYHGCHETMMVASRWATKASSALQLYVGSCMLRATPTVVRAYVETASDVVAHAMTLQDIVTLVDTNAHKAHTLLQIFDNVPNIESPGKGLPYDGSMRDITFEGVSFAYPARVDRLVVRNVTCTFPAGKMTVLRGPNGTGKSTLAFLLSRLYDPLTGIICVGGVPLRDFQTHSWRAHIGYVPQSPVLLPGTIDFNIRLGRALSSSSSSPEVEIAARRAGAHEFIRALPEGYLTRLGVRHTHLSGGQAQRVAIARAYLMCPSLLILDEPSSALDAEAQRHLVATLKELVVSGVTVVCITHAEVFAESADHSVVLTA